MRVGAAPQSLREYVPALDTWMAETGDLGEHPEPPEIVEPFVGEMHDWFGTPDWHTGPR